MKERGASPEDLLHALAKASVCTPDGEKWKTEGPDLEGDELTCIVVIDDNLIVVTIY